MKKRESISRKLFVLFNVIFMLLLVLVMVFPYINVAAKAFNDGADTARGGITIYPRVFTMENFKTVILDKAFPRAAFISVTRVVLGTLLALVVQLMAAYVFTNKELIGRGFFLGFFMIPMYFGGGLIPTYILYSNMGLLNNFLLYILPGCFSLYNMVIIRSYLNGLPEGLKEAARLDGAKEFTILARIIVPLSKPIIATITLWTAVRLWSDWTTTMYYFTKKKMFTLQYILVQILKEAEKIQAMIKEALLRGEDLSVSGFSVTTESVRCAQIIVTTIPIVIVYPFLQKYFISGAMVGAVKD